MSSGDYCTLCGKRTEGRDEANQLRKFDDWDGQPYGWMYVCNACRRRNQRPAAHLPAAPSTEKGE